MDRPKFLFLLAKLDCEALRLYDFTDPEQYAAVGEGLKLDWPRVSPERKRHQPPPLKE